MPETGNGRGFPTGDGEGLGGARRGLKQEPDGAPLGRRIVVTEQGKDTLAQIVADAEPSATREIELNFSTLVLTETVVVKEGFVVRASDGSSPKIQCPTDGPAFAIRWSGPNRVDGVVLQGFTIENCQSSAVTVGPFEPQPLESGSSAQFRGMTFTNNKGALEGGALYIGENATVRISDSEFVGNDAERGGAIFSMSANVTIVGTIFSENSALLAGGAVHVEGSQMVPANLVVNGSTLERNLVLTGGNDPFDLINRIGAPLEYSQFLQLSHPAPSGGAIYGHGLDTLLVQDSVFMDNVATAGGAVFTGEILKARIVNSLFRNNSLSNLDDASEEGNQDGKSMVAEPEIIGAGAHERISHGGAIYAGFVNPGNEFELEGCEFVQNRGNYGGAVHIVGPKITNVLIEDCEFNDNRGYAAGGGVLIRNVGNLAVLNSTIMNNSATAGGGLALANGVGGMVSKLTFSANHAEEGGAVLVFGAGQIQLQEVFFINNSATLNGGAASLVGSLARGYVGFSDAKFAENEAMRGGAIFSDSVSLLDFRRSNLFVNNTAVSGGAILAVGQNHISNKMLVLNVTFESNTAAEHEMCSEGSNGAGAIFCEEGKESKDFPVRMATCGNGFGGAMCLMFNQVPDRAAVDVLIREGEFVNNAAVKGGGIAIRVKGEGWREECPLISSSALGDSCRRIGLVDLNFTGNVGGGDTDDYFTNDATLIYVAHNATPLGPIAYITLDEELNQ
eukprot:evm.model.scf_50.8 EVM.evm.TU.scf_50.8   scf_50:157607-163255(+)